MFLPKARLVLLLAAGLLATTVLYAEDANLLQEGGFEGGLGPWQGYNATLALVETPVHTGIKAASLTTAGTGLAYQDIRVVPGNSYGLSGWVLKNGAPGADVRLRLTWLSAGGEVLWQVDSDVAYADSLEYQFRSVATSVAPSQAKTARAVVVLIASTQATVYLDDFQLLGPSAEPSPTPTATLTPVPTSTPTPSPTATATPVPTATSTPVPSPTVILTPTATPVPTVMPTPTPVPSPTPTQAVTPTPAPVAVPGVSGVGVGVMAVGLAVTALWVARRYGVDTNQLRSSTQTGSCRARQKD